MCRQPTWCWSASATEFGGLQDARIGRMRDELGSGLRSYRVSRTQYLIFYRVHAKCVQIVRVVHGARDLPAVLAPDRAVRAARRPPCGGRGGRSPGGRGRRPRRAIN
jgi:hypothetical protein